MTPALHKVGSPRRQPNQRGEGSRLRGEVIEAAMRLLDRAPARALSLRMVAREAGVAPPSLYRQFADADSMIHEVVVECWQQVATEMRCAGEAAVAGPPIKQLQAQMAAFVRYAMRRPSRYQLLFALPVYWDLEDIGPLRPAYRAVIDAIERHVATGGRLPLDDSVASALLALSLAHGRIALAHLAPSRLGNGAAEIERYVTTSLGRLFGGGTAPHLSEQA